MVVMFGFFLVLVILDILFDGLIVGVDVGCINGEYVLNLMVE